MRKKILDMAWLFLFLISLTVISNIQGEKGMPETADTEVAGTESSENSFTPESDEKTVITKNEIVRVMQPEKELPEESSIEPEKELSEENSIEPETEFPEENVIEPETEFPEESSIEPETEFPEENGIEPETEIPQESREEAVVEETCRNRWNITLTQEETELLARIVWLEARGEPVEGQQAVVEVVFNRMASSLYPDTLYGVLSQSNPVQFCSWKNREYAMPTEKEYQSIKDVLEGKTALLRNDTMYFSTFPLTDHVEQKIGGHYFCY